MLGLGRSRAWALVAPVIVMTLVASPAHGQTTARAWEIEGIAGLFLTPASGDSVLTMPEAGPPLATSSPLFPTRQVPSWWFGDGAALLNGVNSEFGVPDSLRPLEAGLRGLGLGLGRGTRATMGLRVRRAVSPAYAIEVSLELTGGGAALSDEVRDALADTRASFVPAFRGLLATAPVSDVEVDAALVESSAAGREVAITAAIVATGNPFGSFVPYVTLGGGLLAGVGDLPSVTLEGHYRFRVLGEVPIEETDRVTLRWQHRRAFVAVIGGGLRRDVSDRWGVRFDGRVLVGRHGTEFLLDASPQSVTGMPADFIESFTNPAIQFSNNASTGRESTLSGPGLNAFDAFSANRFRARVVVTVGLFFKF